VTFADLLSGVAVFIDANTFVYHFTQHVVFGAACTDLLDRVRRQDLGGWTSSHVLSDVAHRVMTVEATARYSWPAAGVLKRLKQRPADVQALVQPRQAVDDIRAMGVQIAPVTADLVAAATLISQQTGLLTNDALVIAAMQAHGLTHLASHDADFDRVPGLTRYAPA
jgi:predicted nucleic acid-binding protein